MPSLRTRPLADGRTTYTVLYRHHGRQTSSTFDTERAALRFMADCDRYGIDTARRVLATRQPGGPARDTRTVADQLAAYTASLSGITIGTRRTYERHTRTIAAHPLGALPLDIVSRDDVTRWIRDQEAQGLSGKTIRDRQAFLSAALVQAVDDELMVRNVARGVKVGKTERAEKVFLTPAEFDQVLSVVPPAWKPLVVTLAGTGLRIGEATALQVRDLHLDDHPPTLTVARGWVFTAGAGHILGAPKTERGRRTISLPPQVVDLLRPLAVGRAAEDFVFTSGGTVVRQGTVQRLWRGWVKESGITKRPTPHSLRHSHASWLVAAGVPLTIIQHRLGHASITMTSDQYSHLMPEAMVQTARAAEAGFLRGLPAIEA